MTVFRIIVLASLLGFSCNSVADELTDDEIDPAISQSDDYARYKSAFVTAARSLIKSGQSAAAMVAGAGV